MADLSNSEKRSLERLFGMSSGYVLDFTDRTFEEFIIDNTGQNIYESKYDFRSGSKANRLRAFWSKEPNQLVGKLIQELLAYIRESGVTSNQEQLIETCGRIAQRLLTNVPSEKALPSFGAWSITAAEPTSNLRRSLRVFLCHRSEDKATVHALYDRLEIEGFKPWLDTKDLLPGQIWEEEIRAAVRASDVVVVCLSKGSVTKEGFGQKEIKLALDVEEEKPRGTIFIVPVRLEEVDIPIRLSKWHAADLFQQDGYQQLVRALKIRANTLGISVTSQFEPVHGIQAANETNSFLSDGIKLRIDSMNVSARIMRGSPDIFIVFLTNESDETVTVRNIRLFNADGILLTAPHILPPNALQIIQPNGSVSVEWRPQSNPADSLLTLNWTVVKRDVQAMPVDIVIEVGCDVLKQFKRCSTKLRVQVDTWNHKIDPLLF
jgi:hypothetical protein